VYHRDIKPENVMMTKDDENCKICDYGLAKVVGSHNKTFTNLGTPLYQAPEMFPGSAQRGA
jgi:serine/threonine protein kinase